MQVLEPNGFHGQSASPPIEGQWNVVGLSWVGWAVEVARDMLERAVESLGMRDTVWGPRMEKPQWNAERLVVDAETRTQARHLLCNLVHFLHLGVLTVVGVEAP